jgi:YHS domain-containing protein
MNTHQFRTGLLAITTAIALCGALVPLASHAYDENSTAAVNVDAKGIGLKGHDPVAYFTVGAPTAGKAEYTARHDGVTYQFASAANRDTFKAAPAKYAPQFGGFCAMGVALEKKLDGDPAAWTVAEGKLYVNVNKDVQKKYLEDVTGNNKKAEANWPQLRSKTPKSLS